MMNRDKDRYDIGSLATPYFYYQQVSTSILNMLIFYFYKTFFTWNNCLIIMNFGILIPRKINFHIIWYSVKLASTLYLSIFVWSSDLLNFVFINVVILVYYETLCGYYNQPQETIYTFIIHSGGPFYLQQDRIYY